MRQLETAFLKFFVAACIFTSGAKAEALFNDKTNSAPEFTLTTPSAPDSSTTVTIDPAPVQTDHFSIFSSLSEPPPPRTGRQKRNYYLKRTFGVEALLRNAAVAGIQQALNTVPEWGQGMEGYSIRFASSSGQSMIDNSIHLGMGYLLHEDPRYYPSGRSGPWIRSLYAVGQTFITHKDTGEARFAYSRMLGTVGSIYISREWYPERNRTVSEYLSSTATSLGFDAAKNIFSEFWPEIKRMFRR